MIRQLIFDLDGTLVDSCSVCVEILSEMLADRGSDHSIDPVSARPWMSVGGAAMVAALLGPACTDPQRDIEEFRARYRETLTPPNALFAGVAEGLAHFRDAGFTLSICSNKPQALCEQVLGQTGIAGMFKTVVGLRPGLRAKPELDLLTETLGALRCTPRECLFIGDSEIDHQVAQKAGISFVFMSYGYAAPEYRYEGRDIYDCFRTMSRTVARRAVAAHAA
jgi:phosphoglycolate phosphatase